MAKSMTGYGRGDAEKVGMRFTVEVKSVNHRFLEVNVKMPRNYVALEERIRKSINEQLSRGKVDVFVQIKLYGEKKHQLNVDKDLAIVYYNSVKELDSVLGLSTNINALKLLTLPGIIEAEEPQEELEEIWGVLSQSLQLAITGLCKMRAREGEKLIIDVKNRLQEISKHIDGVILRAPIVTENYRKRLSERLIEAFADTAIDETRIIQEVAMFSDKANIDEEIVRLKSHISQLSQLLEETVPIGRKIDFLVQEMNREANTIGSKANDLEISRSSVDIKAEIEKIREQVQNLE